MAMDASTVYDAERASLYDRPLAAPPSALVIRRNWKVRTRLPTVVMPRRVGKREPVASCRTRRPAGPSWPALLPPGVRHRTRQHGHPYGLGVAWGQGLNPDSEAEIALCTPDTLDEALRQIVTW